MSQVSDLLSSSLREHSASFPRPGQRRDMAALGRAAALRVQALALDPDMTDPAWRQGKASHADLMAFYAEKGLI